MSATTTPAATAAGFRGVRAEGDPLLRIGLLAQSEKIE
jgi:hypothetical protein